MSLLLISAFLAGIVIAAAARRAPAVTLLAVCALAGANHLGVLPLPAAITTPIARASARVQAWQARQSAKLVCAAAETQALELQSASRLQSADDACDASTR